MKDKLLTYYKELGINQIPGFLLKYLETKSMSRLKNIGYFCGMDYASKDVYDFAEDITRYDHSLTTSLMTWKLTKDKTMTLAALYHDVSTPCFSHVIDYMFKDYDKQETTEKYLSKIINSDSRLIDYLETDQISIDDIINFKKYTIVDNERPKACVDRIDGVILTGIGWTKNISKEDIGLIVSDLDIYTNEDNEQEIGFRSYDIAKKVVDISDSIDKACHSNEDKYMMELLACITKLAIKKKYIKYEELYQLTEGQIFNILSNTSNVEMIVLLHAFKNIKSKDIPNMELPNVKSRKLVPLVNGKRFTLF